MEIRASYIDLWKGKLIEITMSEIHRHDLKIQDVANKMCVSEVTLRNHIKKHFHTTPSKFLLELRILLAHQIIDQDGKGISTNDICNAIGLKDRRHFRKLYEERYG